MSPWIAFLLILPLVLLAAPPLAAAWLRRNESGRGLPYFPRGKRPVQILPDAHETAHAVRRFRILASDLERELSRETALTELESGVILRRRPSSRSGEPR